MHCITMSLYLLSQGRIESCIDSFKYSVSVMCEDIYGDCL